MIRKNLVLAAAATFLVLLASCGSSGIYDNGPYGTSSRTIHGTVDAVDLNNDSVVLMNTGGYGGGSVRVYFDRDTMVYYNGQNYRPENLDRGDEIDVRVQQSGSRLYADTMTVTYNANPNDNGTPANGGVYASNSYSGTVRYVDTTRRTIELDRGSGSNMILSYDPNTTVMYNGRSYLPGDLEVGDQVTIYTRDIGGGRLIAQNIDVTRSMTSGSGVSNDSNYATLRGTVRSVDAYSRTITMEQTSYVSGFLPNGGNRSSVITVQFDPNARVNVNGSLQPVSGLERGDVIEIQAQDLGNANWMATSITLVRDVRR